MMGPAGAPLGRRRGIRSPLAARLVEGDSRAHGQHGNGQRGAGLDRDSSTSAGGESNGRAADTGARRLRLEVARVHQDRKSTRLNSSHLVISYAVFCLKK